MRAYATMQPCEDWAETLAHHLHIRTTERTAGAFGMRLADPYPFTLTPRVIEKLAVLHGRVAAL